MQQVLDCLGTRKGAADIRTTAQRQHDALEEACTRLIAAGCLPDRAGQPTRLHLHMNLHDFLHGTGRGPAASPGNGCGPGTRPAAGQAGPAAGAARPPLPWPAAGPGGDCDAAVAPILTGRVDHDLLDRLAAQLAQNGNQFWAQTDPHPDAPARHSQPASHSQPDSQAGAHGRPGSCAGPHGTGRPGPGGDLDRAATRHLILTHAIELLSGPAGLASWLRTGTLPPPAASVSLPLDLGTATDIVPPHLRRAIITRDRHCAAPGCDTPPAACHVHHIVPRSQGGTTSLTNCVLLCPFHHLILLHRWGWTLRLHPDGTTTITSPDGRALHSHPPPDTAAA